MSIDYKPHIEIVIKTTDDAYRYADVLVEELKVAISEICKKVDLEVYCTYEVRHERTLWDKQNNKE